MFANDKKHADAAELTKSSDKLLISTNDRQGAINKYDEVIEKDDNTTKNPDKNAPSSFSFGGAGDVGGFNIDNTIAVKHETNTNAIKNLNIRGSSDAPTIKITMEEKPSEAVANSSAVTKCDHTEAQKIYRDLDPQGEIYNNVIKEMKEHIWLHDCARQIGNELANSSRVNFDLEVLKENIIAAAEAIHKGLQNKELKDKFCDNDDLDQKALADDPDEYLFTMALHNLFFALKEDQSEIIGDITEIYGIE